jgi:hypothetical protein
MAKPHHGPKTQGAHLMRSNLLLPSTNRCPDPRNRPRPKLRNRHRLRHARHLRTRKPQAHPRAPGAANVVRSRRMPTMRIGGSWEEDDGWVLSFLYSATRARQVSSRRVYWRGSVNFPYSDSMRGHMRAFSMGGRLSRDAPARPCAPPGSALI